MKLFITTLFFFSTFFLPASPNYQSRETAGIIFFQGTWKEALKKSAVENKPIFLSLSTGWCGWCKKLKQNVFTDKKAGDYFNKNFINIELDGEHDEGQRLAHKFGVNEYPSLFIVDKNENQKLSSEGYHDAEDLIKLFKTGIKNP